MSSISAYSAPLKCSELSIVSCLVARDGHISSIAMSRMLEYHLLRNETEWYCVFDRYDALAHRIYNCFWTFIGMSAMIRMFIRFIRIIRWIRNYRLTTRWYLPSMSLALSVWLSPKRLLLITQCSPAELAVGPSRRNVCYSLQQHCRNSKLIMNDSLPAHYLLTLLIHKHQWRAVNNLY